jgi:hypothetical protein
MNDIYVSNDVNVERNEYSTKVHLTNYKGKTFSIELLFNKKDERDLCGVAVAEEDGEQLVMRLGDGEDEYHVIKTSENDIVSYVFADDGIVLTITMSDTIQKIIITGSLERVTGIDLLKRKVIQF